MAIRAIIFDLDDTLMMDEPISKAAFRVVGEKVLRFGAKAEDFAADCQILAHNLWSKGPHYAYCDAIGISDVECLWGNFDDAQQDSQQLRNWAFPFRETVFSIALHKQLHKSIPAIGAELSEEFGRARRKLQRLMPNAKQVLVHLHSHYCLGMVTNGASSLQREKIVTFGLEAFFKAIAISGERGIGKPKAEIFCQLIAELGMSPSEVIMVGNSKERDIAGAHNAGIRSIWLRIHGSEDLSPAHPHAAISTLSQLPLLIAEMNTGAQ